MAFIEEFDQFDEGTSVMGGKTFEEVAEQMPDNARSGFGTVAPIDALDGSNDEGSSVLAGSGEPPVEKKVVKMSRKMKAAMKKLQDKVSSFPLLYFRNKARQHPEWALEQDEEELINESVSFLFEILNVEFAIEPLNLTLTSIWWAIAYPVTVLSFVFVSHKALFDANHPKETEDDEKPE